MSLAVGEPTAPIATLREQIAQALANETPCPGFRRLSFPIPHQDIYDWLAMQGPGTQMLWDGREDAWHTAGVGEACVVQASPGETAEDIVGQCRAWIDGAADVRFYGGFAFSPEAAVEPAWQSFGAARFWVPRFEMSETPEGTFFSVTLGPADHDPPDLTGLLSEFESLRFGEERPGLPAIAGRQDLPDKPGWCDRVAEVLSLIDDEVLEKLVLARRVSYHFEQGVSAAVIIAKLKGVTSNCYHFVLQPGEGAAFMGTPPERFFRREGRHFTSEVIAGTRPRGADPEEDAALAQSLLSSPKDQNEHDIVRKCMKQCLHLLCEQLSVDQEARLLQLERKQHLQSRIEGTLLADVTDGRLIAELHPTPAVGGYPQRNAVHEIERLEPFRRGWYASPVGWISADAAEFAVAIRSGLVRGQTVDVYSGAGIVDGSDPIEEWREIENKISDFVKVTSIP